MKKILSFFVLFLLILFVLIGCSINGEDGDKGKRGKSGTSGTNGEDGSDGVDGLPGAVVLNPSAIVFTGIVASGDYEVDVTNDVGLVETGFNGNGIVAIKFTNIGSYSMIINNEVLSNYVLMKGKSVIVILSVSDGNINFSVDKFEKIDFCATVCTKELQVELLSYVQ